MVNNAPPTAHLSHLNRADGSATYSAAGYSVVAAVNGPLEAQRRDELSEEAVVDVTVRPGTGVGGVGERHLESMIQSILRHVVLIQNFPRMLIQVTLQVVETPEHEIEATRHAQTSFTLTIIPPLLQATMLALLSASIPLAATFTATLVAVDRSDRAIADPSPSEIRGATSLHVLAFSSHGDVLFAESEGVFGLGMWEEVVRCGKGVCCRLNQTVVDEDAMAVDEQSGNMDVFLRTVMRDKVALDQKWREAVA